MSDLTNPKSLLRHFTSTYSSMSFTRPYVMEFLTWMIRLFIRGLYVLSSVIFFFNASLISCFNLCVNSYLVDILDILLSLILADRRIFASICMDDNFFACLSSSFYWFSLRIFFLISASSTFVCSSILLVCFLVSSLMAVFISSSLSFNLSSFDCCM